MSVGNMSIYQTISRNDLLSYLDTFISENERVFSEKTHIYFGMRNKVRAHILNSINERNMISTSDLHILDCLHNFEKQVLEKESIK
jgi:hypothetical protein